MARVIFVLLCCQLASLPTLAGKNDEENPFMDLAGALLQNMGDSGGLGGANGLAALGGLVGTLMQGDNAKNLGSMLGQGNNAGDVLSGLGSLLTNQNGQIDPAMIGTVINMFAQQNIGNGQASQRNKRENTQDNELGIDNFMSAVAGLLDGKNAGEFLPVLVNTLSSFSGAQADQKAHEHEDHAKFLPPYLEKAHLYWDLFINSELGKVIWEKMGVNKIVKAFQDKDGKVSFEKMLKNLENHSFRRHWIKVAAKYMTESVVHLAKPEVYERTLATGQYILNGFLESQGFPRKTHFNSARPEESLTALSNHIVKRYLDADTDISVYVKPAVTYVKQILSMAKTTGQSILSKTDYNALADRITDILNLEVIEPVMRVYRAYKHSMEAPHCQEHLMCLVNRHQDGAQKGAPGFKAGLTKLSSFVASAALSFQNGKGFWDLYNAIQNDVNCDAHYPADCAAFHEHEMKVTTEIYHTEL